ncbi:MAG: hypothetical protein FWD78_07175 [Treponema sp.]|nr:hypothetical protein [Treponema sp.]
MKSLLKNFLIPALLLFTASFAVFSQEPILLSYQRNFVRASLAMKPGILLDAATDRSSGEFIGALYEFAMKFVLDNSTLFWNDADMIALTGVAARGLRTTGYRDSADTLWKVFLVFQDPYSKVEILETLKSFGKDPQFIFNLNQFILAQNNFLKLGYQIDYTTFSACVSVLGSFRDVSSYNPLFNAYTAGYPQNINLEIQKALESLDGNYRLFLNDMIRGDSPADRLAALKLGTQTNRLNSSEQGDLAQLALQTGLDSVQRDPQSYTLNDSLRYEAILVLTRLKWTRASPLAIRHFYLVQSDFEDDPALKPRFLEAIACLGAMGTLECAQALALQLGYYNSRTEYSGEYDNDIIMTLITALGDTGDKSAFDYLLYVSYLNYPEQIQNAARDALNRLRW